MASSNLKRGSNAVLYTVMAIGIVIFINLIASRFFGRVDLTEDQIYTLSDASKKLVASLPDRMTAKAFISGELPPHPQIKVLDRYTRDLLAEYAAASHGKLVWEVIAVPDATGAEDNKEEHKKITEEARRLKVLPQQVAIFGQTKSSSAQVYLGIAFQYGGKVESIPFVRTTDDLEYQISSLIRRLISDKKRKVAFTTGHGEPPLTRGLAAAKEHLKDYEVTTVDLTEGKKPIPNDVDVLLMVGPGQPLAERAKYEIDQFLMKGKALAMFLDGMVLQTPRGQFGQQAPPRIAQANRTGLNAQLEHYGVKLHQDIVMDRQNQRVRLPAGQNQMVITNYPAFPVVTNLDKKNPMTRKLKGYVSVFPSSVELTPEVIKGKSGVTGDILANSSAASWRQTGFFLFDPLRQPVPTKEVGPFALAVSLKGTFPSFFAGKAIPAIGPAAPGKSDTSNVKAGKPKGDKRAAATARLIVVGDSDLFKDQFLGLSRGGNLSLLLNIVDYLAQDESLIAIRAKSQTRRPLENIEDDTVTMAKVANIVGLPAVFIALGFVRWRLRRARRKQAADEMRKRRA